METFMKIESQRKVHPTAKVIINGLAILCFSRRNDRAEVGFLSVQDHPLLLTVYGPDCQPIAPTPLEINSGTGIKISNGKPGIGAVYQTSADADDNFGNMLNFDELHSASSSAVLGIKPNPYFAKLYLNNGLFYTEARSVQKGSIFPENKPDTPIRTGIRIGKVIGAEIEGETITIDISSQLKPITLEKAGGPYTIIIRYKCCETGATYTDMEDFHKVFDLPPGQPILDLEYEAKEEPYLHNCEKVLNKKGEFNKEMEVDTTTRKLLDNFKKAAEACESGIAPKYPRNLEGLPE